MPGIARIPAVILLVAMLWLVSGCVGPMNLTRRLDEQVNQLYVDSPLFTQALSPILLGGYFCSVAADMSLFNPVIWWRDAIKGQGTPYYYKSPKVPVEEE